MSKLQAIRGMNDILPEETPVWQHLESALNEVFSQYGYQEIRLPILEKTELFVRTIGEVTDVVEKEMYTFDDRNGDSLSLRPEGTAGCVRAGIEHGLLHNQIQKLWYIGPMFRHERPQKGRYRQFHQVGVEAFGLAGPDIDVEMIVMTARLLKQLGLQQKVRLQINTLGTAKERQYYRQALIEYLSEHYDQLDEDSQKRLQTNPLRILDSKKPELQAIIQTAPKLIEYLTKESREHFEQLCQYLNQLSIPYEVTPTLVRGLDYYCHTVFEWVTTELGAQGTVCAGGRYNDLVEQLGGKAIPAMGMAMGLERLVLLLQAQQPTSQPSVDLYVVVSSEVAWLEGMKLAESLRSQNPALMIQVNHGSGSFKSQFKKADKSGAEFAIVIGEDEYASQSVVLKPLREDAEQQTFTHDELLLHLNTHFQQGQGA